MLATLLFDSSGVLSFLSFYDSSSFKFSTLLTNLSRSPVYSPSCVIFLPTFLAFLIREDTGTMARLLMISFLVLPMFFKLLLGLCYRWFVSNFSWPFAQSALVLKKQSMRTHTTHFSSFFAPLSFLFDTFLYARWAL